MNQSREDVAGEEELKGDCAWGVSSRSKRPGRRMWTSHVCIQPLYQRVRCLSHAPKRAGASS